MSEMVERRPWGVHRISNMYPEDVQAKLPSGHWVRAVSMPYTANRLEAAWWVLTGRAYAVIWPEDGELERALGILPKRSSEPSSEPS